MRNVPTGPTKGARTHLWTPCVMPEHGLNLFSQNSPRFGCTLLNIVPKSFHKTDTPTNHHSAYPLNEHLIPAYRGPAANVRINAGINYCLAKSHVRNEHTIGILKGPVHAVDQVMWQPTQRALPNCRLMGLDNEVHQEWQRRHPNDAATADPIHLQRRVKERCVIHKYAFGLLPIRNNRQ
ncbi:hypothetical protein O181_093437 [Austropuccinia psidii MF-1]|uniref:Uncharacterized protein n=1 Tax=Austropuccinia psidii MF-1 TaxID=1389203 RepID=A0A9Q3J114_9BASI|nr:hypothetical protein [Austropuccinia psidii MF-1]